jgi:hypothetical protein
MPNNRRAMDLETLYRSSKPDEDTQPYLELARQLLTNGHERAAASAYDRAYGLDPHNATIQAEGSALLDRLAVAEHGIVFRYIPAGSFLMGSETGDPDERPFTLSSLEIIGWPRRRSHGSSIALFLAGKHHLSACPKSVIISIGMSPSVTFGIRLRRVERKADELSK